MAFLLSFMEKCKLKFKPRSVRLEAIQIIRHNKKTHILATHYRSTFKTSNKKSDQRQINCVKNKLLINLLNL